MKCMAFCLDIHAAFTDNFNFLSWTSSLFGQIGQYALFFHALERQILWWRKCCGHDNAFNQDRHKILDEFDFGPGRSSASGLHALEDRTFPID